MASLLITDDGSYLVTADLAGFLQVYEASPHGLAHFTLVAEVQHLFGLTSMVWSCKRQSVAVTGQDGNIRLYAVPSLEYLQIYFSSVTQNPVQVHFTPTSDELLCGTSAGPISVFSIDSSGPVMEIAGHTATVTSMDFDPAFEALCSADSSGEVILYSVLKKRD